MAIERRESRFQLKIIWLSGISVLLTTSRIIKLECTSVTPSIRVILLIPFHVRYPDAQLIIG